MPPPIQAESSSSPQDIVTPELIDRLRQPWSLFGNPQLHLRGNERPKISSQLPVTKLRTADSILPIPCHYCRSRKKRCYHDESGRRTDNPEPVEPLALESQPDVNTRESSPHPAQLQEYNPEAVLKHLFSLPEPDPADRQSETGRDRVSTAEEAAQKARRRQIWWRTYRQTIAIPPLAEHHRRYLEDVGALLELPRTTVEGLLPAYNSLLDDLIPIMDGPSVLRDFSNGHASRYLVRAMCLVICKAQQAAPFLRLTDDGPLLSHQVFASKLLDGLDAAIKANLEPDRVVKIQVLALMHLHNNGRGGVDRSSMYLTQAIREAWSMSLHLKMPESLDQDLDYLWWSLRNFDRLNKPTMGAGPFIIDDTDISIDRIAPRRESYRSQVLHISLVLGDLTAKATKVYKASSTSTVDDCEDFPSLLELTSGTTFDRFHRSHRAYLEIWYHLAAMLSCRHSGPDNVHYTRRLASADRILEMLGHGQHETLPPLPLVPYAMAMATTVIYRALRDRVRDIDTSSRDLSFCCEALDTLGQRWTTAQGVAKLAHRLMSSSNLGSMNRQRVEAPDKSDSTATAGPATSNERPLIAAHQPINQSGGAEEVIPTPVSLPSDQGFHGDHAPDNPQYLPEQLIEPWVGFDASQFQLQMAFDDLFSHGISDVFRDPASWELLHMANNGSSLGS